jgi:hypothetical protein
MLTGALGDSLCTKLSQNIQNFYKVNVMEIEPTTQDIIENIFEEDLSDIIDNLVNLYFEITKEKWKK